MGLYLVTVINAAGKKMEGVKTLPSEDLDFAFQHFHAKAATALGSIELIRYFDCLKICRESPLWAAWEQKQGTGVGRKGFGKYRSGPKNEGKQLGERGKGDPV